MGQELVSENLTPQTNIPAYHVDSLGMVFFHLLRQTTESKKKKQSFKKIYLFEISHHINFLN